MRYKKSTSKDELVLSLVKGVATKVDFCTKMNSDIEFRYTGELPFIYKMESGQFFQEYRRALRHNIFRNTKSKVFWLYLQLKLIDSGVDSMPRFLRKTEGYIDIERADHKSDFAAHYGTEEFDLMYWEMYDYFYDVLRLAKCRIVSHTPYEIEGVENLIDVCNQILITSLCDYLGPDIVRSAHFDTEVGQERYRYFIRNEIEERWRKLSTSF